MYDPVVHPVVSVHCLAVWGLSFLEQADLSGPAAHLFANGCNGADLFKATSSTLTSELRLTLFAASKVLAAREAFLR